MNPHILMSDNVIASLGDAMLSNTSDGNSLHLLLNDMTTCQTTDSMMLNNLSDFIFKNRHPNSFVYKETNVRHGIWLLNKTLHS